MRSFVLVACALWVVSQSPAPPIVTIFEGARLIAGDGAPPIERAAFIVEGTRIVRVGPEGLAAPPSARRVDLTGKTVMPALVDAHVHLGYRRGLSFSADNHTRANLVETLDRFAYYGVAAVLEAGTGRGDLRLPSATTRRR
jgi:imidazolonepropionase-like amidohydrolase